MTNLKVPPEGTPLYLILEDGASFGGFSFGAPAGNAEGEVVFNTGMVGYPESFTDPSYRGQILTLTYPLIGNYGVPADFGSELSGFYESSKVHLAGLVVSEYSNFHHHWNAKRSLSELLVEEGVAGICGVDTRALTKKLRERGTMQGRICAVAESVSSQVPARHFVSEVSVKEVRTYKVPFGVRAHKKRVAVVDCGCKNTIIRSLLKRGVEVLRVPWDFDVTASAKASKASKASKAVNLAGLTGFAGLDVDGVLFSNGPGDPLVCAPTVETARRVVAAGIPAFGICLGNQILALALGAKTYKLKYGHRGQNQPCVLKGNDRCFITSQNHGYAVDTKTLPEGLEEWFINLNDGTNEGLRHAIKPIMSVQFHPEAMPGPVDTGFLFDEFVGML